MPRSEPRPVHVIVEVTRTRPVSLVDTCRESSTRVNVTEAVGFTRPEGGVNDCVRVLPVIAGREE